MHLLKVKNASELIQLDLQDESYAKVNGSIISTYALRNVSLKATLGRPKLISWNFSVVASILLLTHPPRSYVVDSTDHGSKWYWLKPAAVKEVSTHIAVMTAESFVDMLGLLRFRHTHYLLRRMKEIEGFKWKAIWTRRITFFHFASIYIWSSHNNETVVGS